MSTNQAEISEEAYLLVLGGFKSVIKTMKAEIKELKAEIKTLRKEKENEPDNT